MEEFENYIPSEGDSDHEVDDNDAPLLNLVISELNGYPVVVKYHRKCYQIFTHNLHLERLSKKSEQIQLQDKRNNDRLLQS